jgi:aminopeptidase N
MRDGTGLQWFKDPVDGLVYTHSQFEANDARRVFACFDQPDLKAPFDFRVKAHDGWTVVSNTQGARSADGWWVFPTTRVLPTYVTAIVAGNYHSVHVQHGAIPLGLYCRESLARYLDSDEIFDITRRGLDFFERRFGIPYPFGKYDQLFVPEFSSGAMENAGCVTHNEVMVFRSRVTESIRMRRTENILHEMAHMWFGDMVTMRWWDDIWLNESFAEYMGYVAAVEATRFTNGWLDFATGTMAGAKAQDQLPTTHPIVADIPDVESVALNFDAITYNKGAAVLKQLAAWVGKEAFYKGVTAYLKRHKWASTELPDFLAALEESSGRDLKAWSGVWLERAGVNTITADIEIDHGRITTAALIQHAPPEHPTLRPHRLRVGIFDLQGDALERRAAIELDLDGRRTPVAGLTGTLAADLVLVNDDDLTYTKIGLDPRSLNTLVHHLRGLGEPLARAVAWGALWDMTRDGQMRARDFVDAVLNNIEVEDYVPVVEQLLGRVGTCIELFGAPANRGALRARLAEAARDRLETAAPGSPIQLTWARTLIDAARGPAHVAVVRGLLDGNNPFDGLSVDFDLRWLIVSSLVSIGAAGPELIDAELERDPTDLGRRQAAAAHAARPVADEKAAAWAAILDDGSLSYADRRSLIAGFHRVDQEDLLRLYVAPYFDKLIRVWETRGIEDALMWVRGMYPSTIVEPAAVELTERRLDGDLPGPVRRSLLESQDGVKRALLARAFDSV